MLIGANGLQISQNFNTFYFVTLNRKKINYPLNCDKNKRSKVF